MIEKILQCFSPQLIESFQSIFSGQVDVFLFQNKFFIKAGQIHQSGGWARALFKCANSKFEIRNSKLNNVLLLGLAGGSFVEILTKMYPNINITGVDIDPVMVDIGRKYFELSNYKNLKIKIRDAYQYVEKNTDKYDLVIIDIFQGDKTPKEFSSRDFIHNVVKNTNTAGHIMINRLYLPEFKKQTDEFYENLAHWQKELGYKIINSYQNIGNKVLFIEKRDKIGKE